MTSSFKSRRPTRSCKTLTQSRATTITSGIRTRTLRVPLITPLTLKGKESSERPSSSVSDRISIGRRSKSAQKDRGKRSEKDSTSYGLNSRNSTFAISNVVSSNKCGSKSDNLTRIILPPPIPPRIRLQPTVKRVTPLNLRHLLRQVSRTALHKPQHRRN